MILMLTGTRKLNNFCYTNSNSKLSGMECSMEDFMFNYFSIILRFLLCLKKWLCTVQLYFSNKSSPINISQTILIKCSISIILDLYADQVQFWTVKAAPYLGNICIFLFQSFIQGPLCQKNIGYYSI